MEQLLEAATVAEEVAAAGETVGSVDLATVSQQLGHILSLEAVLILALGLVAGAIIGAAISPVIRRLWE